MYLELIYLFTDDHDPKCQLSYVKGMFLFQLAVVSRSSLSREYWKKPCVLFAVSSWLSVPTTFVVMSKKMRNDVDWRNDNKCRSVIFQQWINVVMYMWPSRGVFKRSLVVVFILCREPGMHCPDCYWSRNVHIGVWKMNRRCRKHVVEALRGWHDACNNHYWRDRTIVTQSVWLLLVQIGRLSAVVSPLDVGGCHLMVFAVICF